MRYAEHTPHKSPIAVNRDAIIALWRSGVGPSSIAVRLGVLRATVVGVLHDVGYRDGDDAVEMHVRRGRFRRTHR